METNRLKRFATEARNILMQGVAHRFTALGFRVDGTPVEEPQLLGGGATFMGDTVTEDFYHKWQSLAAAIRRHGLKDVAEEAAYTWFNRLMAIRIMTKNRLIPPVLQYESPSVYVPLIVSEARQGRLPQMSEEERSKLMPLLDDDSRTAEQFSLLIVAFCHATPILHRCFGHIADYTELLLPANILAEGGFVDLINHTDFIAEEDYRSSELIGWLYQFYIAEKKDEVFAAKGKFTASEIPAATQIFTPNWIVKYMVQNTVGRIYLDNNPYETEVAQDWKYLVNPSEPTPNDLIFRYDDLTDLRLADLACGSGHILGEMFDMLYTLYINEGYSRREAIENIFRRNLTGVDIDTRAKQLAQFALLLKACQRDASFADCHCMPRVLDMPKDRLPMPADTRLANEIEAINKTLADADTLGSIMKFSLSPAAREWVALLGEENEAAQLVLALTDKYAALIANPPYMGRGNMNNTLTAYLDKNYPIAKQDLFATFMQMMIERTQDGGRTAFITMESWMFLSSFEKLRHYIIDNYYISSLGHFGWHIIGIAFGTAMTVIEKNKDYGRIGEYSYLTIDDIDKSKNVPFVFPKKDNGRFAHVSQQNFEKIPGCPIGYWVSEKLVNAFNHSSLDSVCKPSKGMMPGSEYLRNVWEIAFSNITFDVKSHQESKTKKEKWYPYFKGGSFRRWFGNREFVVDYQYDGYRVKEGDRNPSLYFKDNINWSKISSGLFSARTGLIGGLYDDAACQCYVYSHENYDYILGLLNSKVAQTVLWTISQTFNYISSEVAKIPYIKHDEERITELTQQNIAISRADWDAHETSWDFQENEIVRLSKEQGEGSHRLSDLMDAYREHWTEQFLQLHANEEELNRQFIEIYGLEDELTPDVPLSEVTILQQGEVKVTNEYLLTTEDGSIITDETGAGLTVSGKYYLDWQDDVIVKQLISYAVGCMLGRYRLDKLGLHIAHPEPTAEETAPYIFNGQQWNIDEDGILPLMPSDTDFADNATVMFKRWLVVAFGEDTLVDNLNCVEAALGKSLDDYFVKDFWKDHKKMYQNRPIYWLFSSKKGAFQCLAYMHRMNAYTAERIRTKYLLSHIEWLVQQQTEMEANAANLNARERKRLDSITRQIAECREYHDRLHTVADEQIAFDLDDGVVVNYAKFGDVLAKLK